MVGGSESVCTISNRVEETGEKNAGAKKDNTSDIAIVNGVEGDKSDRKWTRDYKLGRTMELDVRDRPRLEPTLKGNDGHDPSEGETRNRDSKARDHHDIISSLPHRSNGQVGGAEHEHQTATSQEETS